MTTFHKILSRLTYCSFVVCLLPSFAVADEPVDKEFYYVVPISDLDIEYRRPYYYSSRSVVPFAKIDDVERVWVCAYRGLDNRREFEIAIRSPRPLTDLNGKIFLPSLDKAELNEYVVSFKLEKAVSKERFYRSIELYYQFLVDGQFAGQPWFQHKLEEARNKQGKKAVGSNNRNRRFRNSIDSTFEIFSGSRAIAENIQLNRDLIIRGESENNIDVETIPGITIKEYDWNPLLKKELPKLDKLAKYVPADQHVIFLHSIQSFQQALAQVSGLMSPAFDAFSIQSVDNQVIPGYLNQLAIDMEEISKSEFGARIQEIAITGSDPYSEIGTDLGVIIQMADEVSAEQFVTYYLKKIKADRKLVEGSQSGYSKSVDRELSAYVFRQGSLLVVSNSEFQIRKIKSCMDGDIANLASLKEFRFFRQRYKLTEDETAFVFMSDAAIRRWCSAEWRIGQSRRLRALASLQRLQASQMENCLKLDDGQRIELEMAPETEKTLGKVSLSRNGVHSTHYGSITFLTPIAELGVKKVSEEEEQAYTRWRNGYQRNWSQAFDPIGIQIKLQPKEVFVDLSVIPIIMNSSYRWLADGKPMLPFAGDLHPNTLIHIIAAPGEGDIFSSIAKGLKSVEVYVDDDTTFWRDFIDEKKAEEYFRRNLQKLPAVLVLDFEDEDARDRFLKAARSFGGHAFESETDLRYKGMTYKKFNLEDGAIFPGEDISFYSDKVDSRVIFTFSEDMIKKSIDRQIKPLANSEKRQLLGKHLSLQVDKRFFRAMEGIALEYHRKTIRNRSWNNLPILQEWKQMFPDVDPLTLHRQYWGQNLICTGGGKYKWDAKLARAYSTAYGHPARPRIPMGTPFPFEGFKMIDAGMSFETDGIRAKLHLKMK